MATDDSPSDLGHTATMPAGSAPARAPAGTTAPNAPVDIESGAGDLQELPTIDPDAYVFGHYFARGGMGRIAAVRDKRLGRIVAIKELIANEPSLVERFKREIRITASLEHPSIVSVHEAGKWPSGEPFFAMRRVAGRSLKDAIAACSTLHERLGLVSSVIAIVDALAYAHQRGIVHRDLKPANVLVGEFGETVVIDWGLASESATHASRSDGWEVRPNERADNRDRGGAEERSQERESRRRAKDVRSDDGDDPISEYTQAMSEHVTVAGSLLGTPAYMAPEQARGEPADERSDVYALGAILYTVLAGDAPYDGSTQAEIVARVLAEPPPPIGARQSGVADDLQAIVARAMARAPADRYPSARELAADLKRFQTGQLVAAHRYTRGQLVARWLRRNRTSILVGAAALAMLIALGIASLLSILDERDRAVAAELGERARSDALVVAQARATVDRDPLRALRWLADLPEGSTEWAAARTVAADARSRGIPQALPIPPREGLDIELSPDGRTVGFTSGRDLAILDVHSGEVRTLGGHRARITDMGFSPDGTRVATASLDNTVSVWNVRGGHIATLTGHEGWVVGVGFTREGGRVVSTSLDRTARIWQLDGTARTAPVRIVAGPFVSRDGRWVAGLAQDSERGLVWDTVANQRVLELTEEPFALGRDGLVAWVGPKRTIALHALATGDKRTLEDAPEEIALLQVSPDGARLVAGTRASGVHVIELATNDRWSYRGREPIVGMMMSDDGAWITAWGRSEAEVHVIHTHTRTGRTLPGAMGPSEISRDGTRVLTRDPRKRVLLWDTAGGTQTLPASDKARRAAVSPDGSRIAYGGPKESVRVWNAGTHATIDLVGHTVPVVGVAWSPNGALLASIDFDKRVRLWEVESRKSIALPGRGLGALAWSPDGARLAVPSDGPGVRLWDVATGALTTLDAGRGWTGWVEFSPDGQRLAAAGRDGVVRSWDLASGRATELGAHEGFVQHGAFSPDGEQFATGGQDGTVRVWSRTGAPLVLRGHTGWVKGVAFDPTGRRLASVATDRSVWQWDVATGAGWPIGNHDDALLDVAFSPSGAVIATTGLDGARLWSTSGTAHRVLRGHTSHVHSATFFPDGKRLATVGADGTVRVWDDDLPHDAASLRTWLAAAAR